jgi:hypothetical protein
MTSSIGMHAASLWRWGGCWEEVECVGGEGMSGLHISCMLATTEGSNGADHDVGQRRCD